MRDMRPSEEKCICGQICNPVAFVGFNRIPLCEKCFNKISDSDIEWDENITSEELKKEIEKI